MRVLLIDKNLIDPINQTKWAHFAQQPGVEIMGVTPATWIENYSKLRFQSSDQATFPIVPLTVVWPGYENRGFYRKGLGRAVRAFGPDIVLAFEEPFSLFGLEAVIASQRFAPSAKRVLYTWDNLSGGQFYPYRPRQLYRTIERWTMKRISLLLAANQEAADRFAGMYPTPVRKLYFGVDIKRFAERANSRSRSRVSDGSFTIGYVGRLLPMKGLPDLLAAMKHLSTSFRLSIVGNGPDLPRLQQVVQYLEIGSRVDFHPAVSSSEVADVFFGVDVLVLPSRTTAFWKEQYGRVLIEAMACGTPVIGSSSGAIPEVLGDTGLVFPEGNPGALADCIKRLGNDADFYSRLSAKGMERANQFSAEAFGRNLHRILVELLCAG